MRTGVGAGGVGAGRCRCTVVFMAGRASQQWSSRYVFFGTIGAICSENLGSRSDLRSPPMTHDARPARPVPPRRQGGHRDRRLVGARRPLRPGAHAVGAQVVLAARRADRLEALAAELDGAPSSCPPTSSDADDRERLVATTRRTRCGRLDVLVNNAGIGGKVALEDEDARPLPGDDGDQRHGALAPRASCPATR